MAAVLASLFVVHLGAAAAHLYPWGVERLSLHLAPFLCLASAGGVTWAFDATATALRSRHRQEASAARLVLPSAGLAATLAIGAIAFGPTVASARPYLHRGWRNEDIRELVRLLADRIEPSEAADRDRRTFECAACAYAETTTVMFR